MFVPRTLSYCSPVWQPHLLTDINNLERIQHHATKYILNNYTNDYKSRLINLNILPLMYTYEIADILFLIKSIKNPSSCFNINNYITFYTGSSQLAEAHKLQHSFGANNTSRHSLACGTPYQSLILSLQLKNNSGLFYSIILLLPRVVPFIFYVHVPDVNHYPSLLTSKTYNLCT